MTDVKTRMKFARFCLSGHNADSKVIPGRWVPTDCAGSKAAVIAIGGFGDLVVWSGSTDTDGERGNHHMFREWGTRDGRTPVIADLYELPNGTCYHLRYEPEVVVSSVCVQTGESAEETTHIRPISPEEFMRGAVDVVFGDSLLEDATVGEVRAEIERRVGQPPPCGMCHRGQHACCVSRGGGIWPCGCCGDS